MTILGLESGAQVIILQGLSTYTALISAYFFARPVLRGQIVLSNREILSNMKSQDADVTNLIERATNILNERVQAEQPLASRDNKRGIALLVASVLLFSSAIILQVRTDPLFHPANPPPGTASTGY